MQTLSMLLGERRRIKVRISSDAGDAFTISDPAYTLTLGTYVEARGTPSVDDHVMSVDVEPSAAGTYVLTMDFSVGGEKLRRKLLLSVRE